jgi:uncharacterized protein YdhG (YjbR/CyaY superfamily)
MNIDGLLSKLSAPARRAIEALKLKRLEDLARYARARIAELHGIGPAALKVIEAELSAQGLGFKDEGPARKAADPAGRLGPIGEYIAACPAEAQPMLKELRGIIAAAAPEARETISYRMPAFEQGGILVYFAAFKGHIGLYPTGSGVAAFEGELSAYKHSKGAIQFPFGTPLPSALIGRIVRFRVGENARKAKAKPGAAKK